MSHSEASARSRTRINVLKKVKVHGQWKLCPVVIETSGRLKDRVRVKGRTELHSEGVYYIEWRENNQRRRQAIPNRNEVLEYARLKGLELDARKAGIEVGASQPVALPIAPTTNVSLTIPRPASIEATKMSRAVRVILQGIESYLQELVGASVKAQLEALGVDTCEIPLESHLSLDSGSDQVQGAGEKSLPEPYDSKTKRPVQGKIRIAQAIESYLKDVEPPQREQKTYDEYRLVLYKFRDNCGKNFIQDINRDDCLIFMRHLYSVGNEARTVFNRMGIVQQLLRLNGITGLLQGRDKPKFVANVRKMYEPQELEALFKACTPDEKFFICSSC